MKDVVTRAATFLYFLGILAFVVSLGIAVDGYMSGHFLSWVLKPVYWGGGALLLTWGFRYILTGRKKILP